MAEMLPRTATWAKWAVGAVLISGAASVVRAEDAPPPPPPATDDAAALLDAAVAPPPPATPPQSEPAAPPPPPPVAAATQVETAQPAQPDPTGLDKVLEARQTGHFTGSPINLQVRDADVADILQLISEASGFNIVVGDDVKGKLTLSLVDVPWDQALDVVLRSLKLGAERNNNLLRIVTLKELTDEKNEELKAKAAAAAVAPTETKVFKISYADPTDLVGILSKFGGSRGMAGAGAAGVPGAPAGAGGGASGSTGSGQLMVDKRTNSVVVQDLPDNVAKMEKLIQILDTQTPQVLIEAKVIEATEGFKNQIGGGLGFGSSTTASNQYFGSISSLNPTDPLIGSPGILSSGGAISGVGAGGIVQSNTFGFSPSLGFIPGLSRLNAVLTFGESNNQTKLLSSPRFVVLNKQSATITQSTPVGIQQTTLVPGAGTQTTVTITQAMLNLTATPTVTNEGSIQLTLNLERDIPQTINVAGQTQSAVANRNMQTQVLIDSGSTLVIGGVYDNQITHVDSGFPVLRDIPVIGFLFGSKEDQIIRTELFFFITPRVLNTSKDAGLASN